MDYKSIEGNKPNQYENVQSEFYVLDKCLRYVYLVNAKTIESFAVFLAFNIAPCPG